MSRDGRGARDARDGDGWLATAETLLRHAEREGATEAEVLVMAESSTLTRFANNEIHQNVAETNATLNLRFVAGRRIGVASSSRTDDEGLRTLAVFREKPRAAENYVVKKGVRFLWLADPAGALWKTFDAKAMPTNILIDKGGRVVRVVPGCTRDGRNAQVLSGEIANLLRVPEAVIVPKKK